MNRCDYKQQFQMTIWNCIRMRYVVLYWFQEVYGSFSHDSNNITLYTIKKNLNNLITIRFFSL